MQAGKQNVELIALSILKNLGQVLCENNLSPHTSIIPLLHLEGPDGLSFFSPNISNRLLLVL